MRDLITFKHKYMGKYIIQNEYDIFYKNIYIGDIIFAKRNKIFIIGYLEIFKQYRKNHYGYQIIDHILSHYKVNCLIGQTLCKSRGFWNKCIKKYEGQRKNIVICENCSSSFIIPRYEITNDEMFELLEISYEI